MSAPANTFFALLAIALVLLMQPDDDIRGSADNAVFSRPRRMPVPTGMFMFQVLRGSYTHNNA